MKALLSFSAIALFAATGMSCTDPVRDQQIADLGDETEGGPGPDHRPGQPCLLCHSEGGPAENKAFAVAGTVYKTAKPGSDGKEDVIVQFVDARGREPAVPAVSGPSGNFYVPLSDWPNISFPIRVGLYEDKDKPPNQVMQTLINREGSCNFCHRPNLDPADLPSDKAAKRAALQATTTSAGQIYFE